MSNSMFHHGLKTSAPIADPLGKQLPSTRDLLAAHIAAAMYLKDKSTRLNGGRHYGREAYCFADEMLKAREDLATEGGSHT